MKPFTVACFGLMIALCQLSNDARAELVLQFSNDGGTTFADVLAIDPSGLTTIDIFLSETGDEQVLLNEGLLGIGLSGRISSGTNATISSAELKPIFDFPIVRRFTSTSLEWDAGIFASPVPMNATIPVGSFQVATVGPGSIVIEFGDIEPGTGSSAVNWLSGRGTVLDQTIFGAGATDTFQLTLSATAIPEPTAITFLALMVCAFGAYRWRGREGSQVQGERRCEAGSQ